MCRPRPRETLRAAPGAFEARGLRGTGAERHPSQGTGWPGEVAEPGGVRVGSGGGRPGRFEALVGEGRSKDGVKSEDLRNRKDKL